MLTPGQTVFVTIEKPAAGGRMIARVGGQVVLVAGAIPGERVTAAIDRVAKGVAYATTVTIEQPSPDRRDTTADPSCGGCLYASISYPRQLEIKALTVADAFARIARLDLPSAVRVAPSPEAGYRMRARLHMRGHRIGFFREGTHQICDFRPTGQLLPATCDVLDRLGAGLRSLGIDDDGDIELAENIDASERVVQIETQSAIHRRTLERLSGTGLTGIVSASAAHGSSHVTDRLAPPGSTTVTLRRHVRAFFQGNRYLLPGLVAHVLARTPANADVLDLYAGSGLFSLAVAAGRGAKVIAVEGDRFAAADLIANAADAGGGVIAVHQAVEAFVATSAVQVACLIADPPRAGISRAALDGILRLRAPRIVYISCDAATLARDARRLADAGYLIASIDAFDLFPNTPHVETVVVLEDGRI